MKYFEHGSEYFMFFSLPSALPFCGLTQVDLAYGDWQAHSLTRAFISLAQVVH